MDKILEKLKQCSPVFTAKKGERLKALNRELFKAGLIATLFFASGPVSITVVHLLGGYSLQETLDKCSNFKWFNPYWKARTPLERLERTNIIHQCTDDPKKRRENDE